MSEITRYEYESLLASTVDEALLHLWLNVAIHNKFVPRTTRNKMLIAWLKPKVKSPKYKLIKSEIKSMINVARAPEGHLEGRLCDLRELAFEYKDKFKDVHKLHQFFKRLEIGGFKSKLYSEEPERLSKVIYIHKTDIEESFSVSNQQEKPICGYVISSDLSELMTLAEQITSHHIEPSKEQRGLMTELLIHPPKR